MADEEVNFWELVEHLKTGWQWLAAGGIVGLAGAIGFVTYTPARYEATAVIRPATVASTALIPMIQPTPVNMTVTATPVEPVAQTMDRLRLVTFYGDNIVKTCQAKTAETLANNVMISFMKGNSLFSISYSTDSATLSETCMEKIVEQLTQTLAEIAAPLIKELESQLASTKQQIDDIGRSLAQSEKRIAISPAPNDAVLLLLKQEELFKLQKLYREQRIQMTAPFTQPLKLLEPVYTRKNAVSKKLIATAGLTGGLLIGLLALFVNRSWRQFKAS